MLIKKLNINICLIKKHTFLSHQHGFCFLALLQYPKKYLCDLHLRVPFPINAKLFVDCENSTEQSYSVKIT